MGYISNQWNRIRKNRDAKTLAGNFMWLSLLQVAGYVFPLITLPYLARVIGVDGFGKIAFAMAVMVWIQTIADWGFNFTATRDVAQNREHPERVAQIFSDVLWARCLLMILSLAVLLLLIVCFETFRENWAVLLVSFLMIPGHILFPDWFFQAIERMKYITLLNLLMKVVFTVAVFLFIKEREDYLLQPLFTSLGYVISGIIALYVILVKWHYRLQRPNFKQAVSQIKSSTDVFINNLFPNLYNSFSTMLLGFWGGAVPIGILDGGNKFVQVGNQILQMFSRVFYPFLSRNTNQHKIYVKIVFSVAVMMAVVLFLIAPWLVKYMLAPGFEDSVWVIRIRAVSFVFLALANAYGANYLIIIHKEHALRRLTGFCSMIGFVIAWPLVYYFSYIGAAVTVTISLALIMLGSRWLARKYQKQRHDKPTKQAFIELAE